MYVKRIKAFITESVLFLIITISSMIFACLLYINIINTNHIIRIKTKFRYDFKHAFTQQLSNKLFLNNSINNKFSSDYRNNFKLLPKIIILNRHVFIVIKNDTIYYYRKYKLIYKESINQFLCDMNNIRVINNYNTQYCNSIINMNKYSSLYQKDIMLIKQRLNCD